MAVDAAPPVQLGNVIRELKAPQLLTNYYTIKKRGYKKMTTKKRRLNPVIVDWVNLLFFGFGLGLGFTTAMMIIFLFITTVLN